METLPLFKDVSEFEQQDLFLRKLNICCFQFDFFDSSKNIREKEMKRETLGELVEFIKSGRGSLSATNQEEMIRMISMNLFRCLPPVSHERAGYGGSDNPEEEEEYLDMLWPHLELVYELLLGYVVSLSSNAKVGKMYIDRAFVLKLLDLFDSEDEREREYLKNILFGIYEIFKVHRIFIRKAIGDVFCRFIYETERHNGIGELLVVIGNLINGFSLPIEEEHKLFFSRILVPLHKPKSVAVYHQPLSYCVVMFVKMDCKLAETIIRGLLKYWPLANSTKESLFLEELEEVLQATQTAEFQRCMVPLFKKMSCCLKSCHFQVAEGALLLFKNEQIMNLITENRSVILPIVFEALERNVQSHWNQEVHELIVGVRKMFLEMDRYLFAECQRQYAEKPEEKWK